MESICDFRRIGNEQADELLVQWGHMLGGCNRPFGRESFALFVGLLPISVAVSASTVNSRCADMGRQELVELARLCSAPGHRWATRVCIRLWRELAAPAWPYWKARAAVSYSQLNQHTGDVYRFDGWRKVKEVRGGKAGGNWTRGKVYQPKSVWRFMFPVTG